MSIHRGLVLDANIVLRAVFGIKVRRILEEYEDEVGFYSPSLSFQEALKYVPAIAERQRQSLPEALVMLDRISLLIRPIHQDFYTEFKASALSRIDTEIPTTGQWSPLLCY